MKWLRGIGYVCVVVAMVGLIATFWQFRNMYDDFGQEQTTVRDDEVMDARVRLMYRMGMASSTVGAIGLTLLISRNLIQGLRERKKYLDMVEKD